MAVRIESTKKVSGKGMVRSSLKDPPPPPPSKKKPLPDEKGLVRLWL